MELIKAFAFGGLQYADHLRRPRRRNWTTRRCRRSARTLGAGAGQRRAALLDHPRGHGGQDAVPDLSKVTLPATWRGRFKSAWNAPRPIARNARRSESRQPTELGRKLKRLRPWVQTGFPRRVAGAARPMAAWHSRLRLPLLLLSAFVLRLSRRCRRQLRGAAARGRWKCPTCCIGILLLVGARERVARLRLGLSRSVSCRI